MIGLKNIQTVIGLLSLLIAYFLTIGPVGFFKAWVAKKMGDDTAEQQGFMTLDPFVHVDGMGLLCLLLFSQPEKLSGFGWGRYVPINPHNIQGKYRKLRLVCAFFSDAVACFFLAVIALTLGTLLLDPASMYAVSSVTFSRVIMYLIMAFVGLNISLALIKGIIDAVMLIGFLIADSNITMSSYMYYVILFAPVVLVILLGNELRQLIIYGALALQSLLSGSSL
jgi:hypothetical protein